MALSSLITWEVRTTGNDLNGGGFKAGAAGTDYSQQDAAQKAGADLAMHATTAGKVKPTAAGVAAADVGNVIYIASGTDWTPGFYEITAQDGTYWTLAGAAAPSATGNANLATYKMGGAVASPGMISGAVVSGDLVYIKYGTYTITTASTNVSGGCLSFTTARNPLISYNTTRTPGNADASRATLILNAGVSTATMAVANSASNITLIRLIVDGAAQTASRGLSNVNAIGCLIQNCTNSGASAGYLFNCEITGCSAQPAVLNGVAVLCNAHDNTITAYSGANCFRCIADSNSGAASDGFGGLVINTVVECTAYNNGRHGINSTARASTIANCVSEGNTGYGINAGETRSPTLNCAVYNNTGGATLNTTDIGLITVTAGSVFVDAAGGNFELNNLAGRGALLRAAGYPATFPAEVTRSRHDIGASQSYPTTHRGMDGGLRA